MCWGWSWYDIFFTAVKLGAVGVVLGAIFVIAGLKFFAWYTMGICKSTRKMNGKTVIITGATSGIGKETAKDLARRGARVILACRNLEKANAAKEEIIKKSGNESIVVKKLDISSLKSVREFAEDINKTEEKIDVLIHNAGTAEMKTVVTEDGLETTMATNYFGPFLLTHLLIDTLKKSGNARIVVVASELYRLASLNLERLNPLDSWVPAYLYYVSKYAITVFSQELARRLEGTGVTANCLHPGMIDSGIWRNVPIPLNWLLMIPVKMFFKTPKQGAQTSIYAAVSEELDGVNGKYLMDCHKRGLTRGVKSTSKGKKLWELSEEFVKLSPTDPKI